MTTTPSPARAAAKAWPALKAPRGFVSYLFAVDLAAAVVALVGLAEARPTPHAAAVLLALIAMGVGFEEAVSRAARLQIRLSSDLKRDMTSVWAVASAVALGQASASLLLTAILVYVWFRQQRPAGQHLYRRVFNGATVLLAAAASGWAVDRLGDALPPMYWGIRGTILVAVGILAYTGVNRLLVTFALLGMGLRGRVLLGGKDDNLIELATLCLGGLVALAVMYEPWSTIFVLVPMVALQRGALVRELEAVAMTDTKTGLLNAVAWEQLAGKELARARRESYPMSILIIDIDRFKSVNDRFGHLVGDKVLHGLGKSLKSSLREYDGIGRFGGEEFVAVLPETDEHDALVAAERMRARANQLVVDELAGNADGDHLERLSVSIGLAIMPTDGVELADLLHAADQALYRAKEGGRNRVCLAHRGDGIPERVSS